MMKSKIENKKDESLTEGVCPFCPFGLKGSKFDVFDEIMLHLREHHFREVVDFWLEHGDIRKDMVGEKRTLSETKRRAVKNFGGELLSNKPNEVKCPFCDFEPAEEYDPWEDTLIHIADRHFDEFVEWVDENYMGFLLAMNEMAVETTMEDIEFVEEES